MSDDLKIIDGKEYTEMNIESISINGLLSNNEFTLNDISDNNTIIFEIEINKNN